MNTVVRENPVGAAFAGVRLTAREWCEEVPFETRDLELERELLEAFGVLDVDQVVKAAVEIGDDVTAPAAFLLGVAAGWYGRELATSEGVIGG